jgi:hypothetical protein
MNDSEHVDNFVDTGILQKHLVSSSFNRPQRMSLKTQVVYNKCLSSESPQCLGRSLAVSKASLGISPLSNFSITWEICFSLKANPSGLNGRGFATVLPRSALVSAVGCTAQRRTHS